MEQRKAERRRKAQERRGQDGGKGIK